MAMIRELMHTEPITLEAEAAALDAARRMRDADIGDVLVTDKGELKGIVTDRDLVIRCMAQGEDPAATRLGTLCSADLVTVSPDDDAASAVKLMKEKAVRRLPVVEKGKPVGIVSIGDLAVELDRESALGEISAAPANN